MPVAISIHHSSSIFNYFKHLKLGLFLSDISLSHLMSVASSVFYDGYRGKTVDFSRAASCHRTTTAHFLNRGRWDDRQLQTVLRQEVIRHIYREAVRSGQPVFCIVDDTIASHTKPSSQALHPIEATYFHQSHLKGCQDYGHQIVSVLLSCNGITLNYAVILYDKTRSKIQIIQEIAQELPVAPVLSYFLCDCWYTSVRVMESFALKGFYTIGALKTNRIIYPCGIRQKVSEYALHIRKEDADVSLVTVDRQEFYVYRYEGELNDIANAAVIFSYPKEAFGNKKALRVFISTNVGISTKEILEQYARRWEIEVYFRQSKGKLGLNTCQLRSQQGIERYWLLMMMVYNMCSTCEGAYYKFEMGYQYFKQTIKTEHLKNIYQYAKTGVTLDEFMKAVG